MAETVDERRAHVFRVVREAEAATADSDKALWWLSFTDPDVEATIPRAQRRAGGPAFLGVCVVAAATPVGAMLVAHDKGCNPGGRVLTFGPLSLDAIDPQWRDRLLTAAEAMSIPEPKPYATN